MSNFENTFQGDLVYPGDPGYDKAIARWAGNAQRNAKLVAFVKGPEDVSLALKYARENKLEVAIRGGGHSPAGSSSSEGGIVIDLSRYLNEAKVDPESKLAYVGGGALWAAVDKSAIEHGLATVGGTVNHTGVGGLTLGGGYGWLSGAHGLVIDNLIQATVVIADGTVLTASETENADLFFGIRGGGSNFGVVTEFVLKLYPQRRTVFAGIVIFPPSALQKLVALTQEWWTRGPSDNESMMQMLTRGPNGNPALIVMLFYNGSESEGRENYRAFYELGPVADFAKEVPYEEVNAMVNQENSHGPGAYIRGVTQHKPDFDSISVAYERLLNLTESKELTIGLGLEYFPLHKINSIPNGTSAFRRGNPGNVLILVKWKDLTAENATLGRNAARELGDIIIKGQKDLSLSQPLGYGNYDSEIIPIEGDGLLAETRAKTLFGDNYPKLREIKKKYDPGLVFSKWFAIPPAA